MRSPLVDEGVGHAPGEGIQCMPPNCAKCISVQVKRGRLLQVSRADRTTDPVESSGWD